MEITEKIKNGKFAMLAQRNGDKELDFNNKYFIQPKLDGVRCIISKDGAFSRNGKEFKNVDHILAEFKPVFEYAPELIFDGELYNHALKDDFNKIISLVRKTVNITQEQRDEARELVQFHCYDIINEKYPDATYSTRENNIHHIVVDKYKMLYTHTVDAVVVSNQKMLNKVHKTNKRNGYEGSMVRSNTPYEHKRSWSLQKVKDWSDTEITITGFVEGKGKFSNGLGKFIGEDGNGRTVEVPWPSLTILKRRDVWANRESYIGKELTFEYFERTPAGAYRFPRAKTIRNYE